MGSTDSKQPPETKSDTLPLSEFGVSEEESIYNEIVPGT